MNHYVQGNPANSGSDSDVDAINLFDLFFFVPSQNDDLEIHDIRIIMVLGV